MCAFGGEAPFRCRATGCRHVSNRPWNTSCMPSPLGKPPVSRVPRTPDCLVRSPCHTVHGLPSPTKNPSPRDARLGRSGGRRMNDSCSWNAASTCCVVDAWTSSRSFPPIPTNRYLRCAGGFPEAGRAGRSMPRSSRGSCPGVADVHRLCPSTRKPSRRSW